MTHTRLNLILASAGVVLIGQLGCGPRVEPGPIPLTSPNKQIKRIRVVRGRGNTRHERTLWDLGDGPVEPMDRIAGLRRAIPAVLKERLATTQPIQFKANAKPVETPVYIARATVVSLAPDVMIVTVRENGKVHPFGEWNLASTKARRDYIDRHRELIGADGVTLGYHAGTLLPWSSEMYVVSCDPNVATEELTFVNDVAEVGLPNGTLKLTHANGDVTVERW